MTIDRRQTITRSLTIAAKGRTGGVGMLAPRTKRKYAQQMRKFSEWCRTESRRPMPATPETLAEFAFYLVTEREYKRSSAEDAIKAVRYFHVLRGHPVPNKLAAWYVLRVADSTPDHVARQARASRRFVLDAILHAHPEGAPKEIRDRAVVALGYGAMLTNVEMVDLDVTHVRMMRGGMSLRLRTRTTVVPHDHQGLVCAVCAVQAWITVLRGRGVRSGPLLRWIDKSGRLAGTGEAMAGHRSAGDRLSPRAINKVYARLRVLAGVPSEEAPLPKDLRFAGVIDARRRGASVAEIGRRAGYKPGSDWLLRSVARADEYLEQERNGL